MSFFPKTSCYSILLERQDARRQVLINLFPQRVIMRNGYTHDDFIMSLIADAHFNCESLRWNLDYDPYKNETFNHPYATVYNGGVQLSVSTNGIIKKTNDMIVASMDDTHIFIEDKVFDRKTFTQRPAYLQRSYEKSMKHIRQSQYAQSYSLTMGALSRLCGAKIHENSDIGAQLAASRFARINALNQKSGWMALAEGYGEANQLKEALLNAWILRPSKVVGAQHYALTNEFEHLDGKKNPDLYKAGEDIADLVKNETRDWSTIVQDMHKSAHDVMMDKKLLNQIDIIIARATPLHLLTTMGQRLKKKHESTS